MSLVGFFCRTKDKESKLCNVSDLKRTRVDYNKSQGSRRKLNKTGSWTVIIWQKMVMRVFSEVLWKGDLKNRCFSKKKMEERTEGSSKKLEKKKRDGRTRMCRTMTKRTQWLKWKRRKKRREKKRSNGGGSRTLQAEKIKIKEGREKME